MRMHHAQRQHIIHSLDSLLYQLHTLSFLLSPALWVFICRVASQFQWSKPREIDSSLSLRFWVMLIVFFNFGGVWGHATEGQAQGRSVILDFVGMANAPSKMHLLCLDFLIIFLQILLTTIAYETSLTAAMPSDTPDPLLPNPAMPVAPLSTLAEEPYKSIELPPSEVPYVIDVRLSTIIERLRRPPPPPQGRESSGEELLPLPNTTPWQLPSSLRMFMRTRTQLRERARSTEPATDGAGRRIDANVARDVPGGMDTEDGI
ncbi:hypothetical protein B0H21DRAFT_761568 [Amylocystis lapponica]|nr:hypothetical protein B0H21DRAFT_761568 [Amylocystis lapponica]